MTDDIKHLRGSWNFPTTIWFGAGKISLLPRACQELGMARPLVVTDPGLAGLPMIADTLRALEEADMAATLFSDIKGNPVGRNVFDGVDVLHDSDCDGVITRHGGFP